MPNQLYSVTGNPPAGKLGRSAEIRAEFALVAAGLDKLRHVQDIYFEDANSALHSRHSVLPFGATLEKVYAVQEANNSAADTILTVKINGVIVTNGAVTIALADTLGSINTSTPTALNIGTVGQLVEVSSDGGGTGAMPVRIILVWTFD